LRRQALLFDCDGVLVDTERDGHRLAFNEAFKRIGLLCVWSRGRMRDGHLHGIWALYTGTGAGP